MPLQGVASHQKSPAEGLGGASAIGEADRFVVGLDDHRAIDADLLGPKAANLAGLARAGLPTPGGFCITAEAYRLQCAALGLGDALARYGEATPPEQRRLSVEIRLKLYQAAIEPQILEPLLAAWRAQWQASGQPGAIRSSALIEDRAG